MISFKQFFVEKNILGLEEDIEVGGIGKIKAKLDTGNGAFNVLHGEDLECDGELVRFTTVNGFRVEKFLEDTITINIGSGNKEERPICLFDCSIGGVMFEKTPFSIGNRADNEHKVLIGKDFIANELDALIDVGLINVAHDKLNTNI